jgi:hypothetical protein
MRFSAYLPPGTETITIHDEDGSTGRIVVRGLTVAEATAASASDGVERLRVYLSGVVSVDGVEDDDGNPLDLDGFRALLLDSPGAAGLCIHIVGVVAKRSTLGPAEGN